jgi:large subunit ribosomal protein L17
MSSHRMRGRQLSVDTEHRKAIRRNLAQSLIEHGAIRTTLPKAKEVQPLVEKLITLARTGTLNARRQVIATMQDRRVTDEDQEFITDDKGREMTVVRRLFDEVAPKFEGRAGGYTQIIKTAKHRIGDGGELVILQLVTNATAPTGTVRRSAGLRRKRNEKKHQFAAKLAKGKKAEAAEAAPAAGA